MYRNAKCYYSHNIPVDQLETDPKNLFTRPTTPRNQFKFWDLYDAMVNFYKGVIPMDEIRDTIGRCTTEHREAFRADASIPSPVKELLAQYNVT